MMRDTRFDTACNKHQYPADNCADCEHIEVCVTAARQVEQLAVLKILVEHPPSVTIASLAHKLEMTAVLDVAYDTWFENGKQWDEGKIVSALHHALIPGIFSGTYTKAIGESV